MKRLLTIAVATVSLIACGSNSTDDADSSDTAPPTTEYVIPDCPKVGEVIPASLMDEPHCRFDDPTEPGESELLDVYTFREGEAGWQGPIKCDYVSWIYTGYDPSYQYHGFSGSPGEVLGEPEYGDYDCGGGEEAEAAAPAVTVAPTTTTAHTVPTPPTTAYTPPPPPTRPGITAEEFAQIQTGMTVDEVSAIVGTPGEVRVDSNIAGTHGLILAWESETLDSYGNAQIQFQDDVAISKAQFGL